MPQPDANAMNASAINTSAINTSAINTPDTARTRSPHTNLKF
jgi:hypothetical protein